MTRVPLGLFAYNRKFAGEVEIELVNRFVEQDPANFREHIALISRPGNKKLGDFQPDIYGLPIRGLYSKKGLFNDDLFVVSGHNLYRYDPTAKTTTQIQGYLQGDGRVFGAWTKGIGYERAFFTDGVGLYYYDGGTNATGALTQTALPTTQIVRIGAEFYGWNAAVDTNSPDGSAQAPWLANPGTDPLTALANLLNYTGTPGTDFSTQLGGQNTQVTAATTGGPPATTLTLTSVDTSAAANSIGTSVVPVSQLSGTVTPTNQVVQIGSVYFTWKTPVTVYTGAIPDGSAANPWRVDPKTDPLGQLIKAINLTGQQGVDYSPGLTAANPNVRAVKVGTAMEVRFINLAVAPTTVALAVTGTAGYTWSSATPVAPTGITWGAATLTGGGIERLKQILIPTGEPPGPLATLGGFVVVGIVGSQKAFYLRPGSVVMNGLDYLEKESNPDPITELTTLGDMIHVHGLGSYEVWYLTGDNKNPILPVEGRTIAKGAIEGTVVEMPGAVGYGSGIMVFVGNDGIVYQTGAWGMLERISTPGIEERIRYALRAELGVT